MPLSIATLLTATQQMLSAFASPQNVPVVSTRGGNTSFISTGQAVRARVQQLNNEQEKLKAELKLKTADLEAAQKELKAWHSEGCTIVKLAYRSQQEKWVEFGLNARR